MDVGRQLTGFVLLSTSTAPHKVSEGVGTEPTVWKPFLLPPSSGKEEIKSECGQQPAVGKETIWGAGNTAGLPRPLYLPILPAPTLCQAYL